MREFLGGLCLVLSLQFAQALHQPKPAGTKVANASKAGVALRRSTQERPGKNLNVSIGGAGAKHVNVSIEKGSIKHVNMSIKDAQVKSGSNHVKMNISDDNVKQVKVGISDGGIEHVTMGIEDDVTKSSTDKPVMGVKVGFEDGNSTRDVNMTVNGNTSISFANISMNISVEDRPDDANITKASEANTTKANATEANTTKAAEADTKATKSAGAKAKDEDEDEYDFPPRAKDEDFFGMPFGMPNSEKEYSGRDWEKVWEDEIASMIPKKKAAKIHIEDGGSCADTAVWPQQRFQLTSAMCAKTRPHRSVSSGNEKVLDKLRDGKCISITNLGGSVSWGSCGSCGVMQQIPDKEHNVWVAQFVKWLNENYPCKGEHTLHNLAERAKGSEYWADEISSWKADTQHPVWNSDIVFMEVGVNDVQTNLKAWEPGDVQRIPGITFEAWTLIKSLTEVIAREVKYSPNKPWVIWAELAFQNFDLESPPPHHWDAIATHFPVLRHYDIDQVSMLNAFSPILTQVKSDWLHDVYFNDHVHPTLLGHQMCAQAMAWMVTEEFHFMDQRRNEMANADALPPAIVNDFHDAPDPFVISKTIAHIYDTHTAKHFPLWDEAEASPYIYENTGFQFFADVEGKPGLIGMMAGAFLRVHMPIVYQEDTKMKIVDIGLLKSYVGMGKVEIGYWVTTDSCDSVQKGGDKEVFTYINVDTQWIFQNSIRQVVGLTVDMKNPEDKCMVMTFRVHETGREKNKIKLLDITFI